MSLFLGPIHHWLFKKIKTFENLEKDIMELAKNDSSIPYDEWLGDISSQYGQPIENNNLEEIIDTTNIHGWLQNKISLAELRHAYWITHLINHDSSYENRLEEVFQSNGEKVGRLSKNSYSTTSPSEVYKVLNDYLLEGMPCDRVMQIVEETEKKCSWIMTTCLHSAYWEKINGKVDIFYKLRDIWLSSFITAIDPQFEYTVEQKNNEKIYSIVMK